MRPGSESTDCYARVTEVPAGEWESVAGPYGYYVNAPCLAALENLRRRRRLMYLVLREQGRPVAAVICSLLDHEQLLPSLDVAALFFGGEAEAEPPPAVELGSLYPMLVCGALGNRPNRLLVRSDLDASARLRVLRRLADEVRRYALESGAASIVYPYLPTDELAELSSVVDGLPAFAPPDYYLPLDLSSPPDYLARVRRPGNVLLEMRRFAEAGMRTEIRRLSECDLATLARLWLLTASKYTTPRKLDDAIGSLRAIANELDPATRVSLGFKGEDVIGFSLNIKTDDSYESRVCGFDYESLTRTDFAYFNVVYYATIQAGVIEGIRAILYGAGSADAKLLRGCRVLPLSFLILPPEGFPREACRRHLLERSRRDISAVAAQARQLGPAAAAFDLDATADYFGRLEGA